MGNYFEVTGSGGSEGLVDFKKKGSTNLVIESGTVLPATGTEGHIFWKSDTDTLYVDTGASWAVISAAFPLLAPDGTSSAPSYSFSNDPTLGIYRTGSGYLGLSEMVSIDSTLHVYDGLGSNPGIHFQGASSNTGLYNSGNSLLYIVGGGIYANFNTSSYIFNLSGRSSLNAGINGEAATLNIYPSTSSRGTLTLSATNNAGNTVTTITNASQAGARTYTIPDAGASANFILSEGSKTINGVTTFGNDVGIGGSPVTSGILTLTSTSEAFVPTRMTTTQRDAISSPTAGMLLYNTTSNQLNYYDGTWQALSAGGVSFPLLGSAGSAAAPTYSFSGDTNTGMFRNGASDLGFAAGGSLVMDISTGALTSAVTIQTPDGSRNSPSLRFTAEDSGWYRAGANDIRFAIDVSGVGRDHLRISATGVYMYDLSSNILYQFETDARFFAQLSPSSGGASTPGISWFVNGDGGSNTGIYRISNASFGFTTAGTGRVLVENGGFRPVTDNSVYCGTASFRFNDIYGVTLHSGDIELDNHWRITEGDKVGHPEEGVMLLSPDGRKFKIAMTEVE